MREPLRWARPLRGTATGTAGSVVPSRPLVARKGIGQWDALSGGSPEGRSSAPGPYCRREDTSGEGRTGDSAPLARSRQG